MIGWHHQLNGHGFGWTLGVGDGQWGLACCGSWGCKVGHDWATELNWTDAIFHSQTCTNKGSRSLFGALLPLWSTTALWIPMKPLHLRRMLNKWMRCTENCSTGIGQQKGPNSLQQSWMNWATKFCLICHIHLTLANQLPLLEASWQLFAGKMLPQPEEAGNAFQEFVESQSMDFYARRISKLISHWERCVDYNGSYFD